MCCVGGVFEGQAEARFTGVQSYFPSDFACVLKSPV